MKSPLLDRSVNIRAKAQNALRAYDALSDTIRKLEWLRDRYVQGALERSLRQIKEELGFNRLPSAVQQAWLELELNHSTYEALDLLLLHHLAQSWLESNPIPTERSHSLALPYVAQLPSEPEPRILPVVEM